MEEVLYDPDEPVAVVYELLPAETVATLVREVVVPLLEPVLYEARSRVAAVREEVMVPFVPVRPLVIFTAEPVRPETTAERVVRAEVPSERMARFVPSATAVYAVVRVPVLVRVPATEAVVLVPPVREPPDMPPTAVALEFPTRVPFA